MTGASAARHSRAVATLVASGTKLIGLPHSNETAFGVLGLGIAGLVLFARSTRAAPALSG